MRISKKTKNCLTFECGAKCQDGESWIRFEVCDSGDKKTIEIDKAEMCCDVIMTEQNMRTLAEWLHRLDIIRLWK